MKLFWSLLILTAPNLAAAKGAVLGEITVRQHSVIQHDSPVVLGDILEFRDVDTTIKQVLMTVPLAAAPNAGEKLVFSSAAISGFVRTALAELKSAPPKLWIPKLVVVERLTHQWDRASIEKELIGFWQPLCADCQLEIDQLSLPSGTFTDWKMAPKKELPHGGFSVAVAISKLGETVNLWLQGNLIVRRSVPVAKRALFIGERAQPNDFEWSFRDVTFSQDGVPTASDIGNRRMKSSLRANDILWSGMLERDKAVHRGDQTRVVTSHGGWEISLSAIAQQDAEIGDTITLKTKSNRDLTGVVSAKDEVSIE
jgi:flagella basal body P-ring formation protein FlgA